MMDSGWYYVQGSERVGPVDKTKLSQLFVSGDLNEDSYVWKKEAKSHSLSEDRFLTCNLRYAKFLKFGISANSKTI